MAFIPTIGAILAGHRTYDYGISKPTGKPYGGAFKGPIVIVSHRSAPKGHEAQVSFCHDLTEALTLAHTKAAGQNIAVLGPSIGQQLLNAGLIDELIIHVAPILIGAGVAAFALGTPKQHSFEVLERSGEKDMTTLRLRPRARP